MELLHPPYLQLVFGKQSDELLQVLQRIASQALAVLDFAEDDVIFFMGALFFFCVGGWSLLFGGGVEVFLRREGGW